MQICAELGDHFEQMKLTANKGTLGSPFCFNGSSRVRTKVLPPTAPSSNTNAFKTRTVGSEVYGEVHVTHRSAGLT